MLPSIKKNREAALNCIDKYIKENWMNLPTDEKQWKNNLIDFTRKLSESLLERVKDEDCYFIDMLEDLIKLGEK